MAAYYNDNDPDACAWLRELIRVGVIPDGEVDCRSILDVEPDDVAGFRQCHFFAGIGGWSYALRLAGWPDDLPVWTGSPPCQPFSVAGKGLAQDDSRHLAPAFLRLVRAARPPLLFGEQVASAAVFGCAATTTKRAAGGEPEWAWLDALFDGLEAAGYAAGAGDIPAAGVGAPHIRQRCFFGAVRLADAQHAQRWSLNQHREDGRDRPHSGREKAHDKFRARGEVFRLADGFGARLEGHAGHGDKGNESGWFDAESAGSVAPRGSVCGLADAAGGGHQSRARDAGIRSANNGARASSHQLGVDGSYDWPGAVHSPWRYADWLFCRDAKWRPVEPGTFPLADGIPARVGRLRGYGNAIVPQAAAQFVTAFIESLR